MAEAEEGDICDPDLSLDGMKHAKDQGKAYSNTFGNMPLVALVSPLLRAARTALMVLPPQTRIIFMKEMAEIGSDKFKPNGASERLEQPKSDTGRIRQDLEKELASLMQGREYSWCDVQPREKWWREQPPTKHEAEACLAAVYEKVMSLPPDVGVVLVGHSIWFKLAVPFDKRPKAPGPKMPSPLGTAAAYWPKNAVPYMGTLVEGSFKLLRRIQATERVDEELRQENGGRHIVLLRHGHSQAQVLRSEKRKAEKAEKAAHAKKAFKR